MTRIGSINSELGYLNRIIQLEQQAEAPAARNFKFNKQQVLLAF